MSEDKIKNKKNSKYSDEEKKHLEQYINNNDEEDDDQRFVAEENINEALFDNIKEELDETQKNLEGVLPESNQQRNLDREVGGLEAKEYKPPVEKEDTQDIWDDRSEEIIEMNEEAAEEIIDAATSSMRQSFIGKQKRDKKRAKKNQEEAAESFEEMSHVNRLKNLKEDRTTADGYERVR